MPDKVIISAALTGGATPWEKNQNLPVTPAEIAEDAYTCWKAGAAVVHLHMRDENKKGSLDAELFRETIRLIRAHEDCDVIVNCSSSGEHGASGERRLEHFRTVEGIELGSYDIDSFNWGMGGIFSNPGPWLKELAQVLRDRKIKPEIEIFDEGMLYLTQLYLQKGILQGPIWCQLVLGVLGGMEATVENLVYLVGKLPQNAVWSVTGIGAGHLPMLYAALAMGGHLRVGLEDNLYYAPGEKATNVQLVERAVRIVKECGKQPATPAQAREIIGLSPWKGGLNDV